MARQNNLYASVVKITEDYLGPAAKRFVDRQITNHLGKDPELLAVKDLPVLIDWSKVAVALLTEDTRLIEEFGARLRRLSVKPKPKTIR